MDIYDKLGLKKIINAEGTVTRLGGSLMNPHVLDAMVAASRHFVDLPELLEKSGQYVAELLGVEAAYITSGAAGGLTLSTAACITGTDPAKIQQLPYLHGLKNEVLIQKSHRNGYDHAIRQVGVTLVEFGMIKETRPWEMRAAISENTVAAAYFPEFENYRNMPLEQFIAIAHEAGIHQDGVLKNTLTYEIMKPETVGLSASKLVLGKHSGRHALKERLVTLGYTLDEESLNKLFDRFKALADKKKTITDADIEALISDEIYQNEVIFTLEGLQVACGTMGLPTATVRLAGPDGETHIYAAIGTGPVDATFKAIDAIVQMDSTLVDFVIHAITEGIDALGEVTVRIATKDLPAVMTAQKEIERPCTFGGYGADTDIIVASAKAYLSAINKMLASTGKYGPVETPAVQTVAG